MLLFLFDTTFFIFNATYKRLFINNTAGMALEQSTKNSKFAYLSVKRERFVLEYEKRKKSAQRQLFLVNHYKLCCYSGGKKISFFFFFKNKKVSKNKKRMLSVKWLIS